MPGHISKEKHNSKIYMHPNIHCSTIYNSQDMEATYMSVNRGTDKADVVQISLEGMMLKRKLQYFGHLMQRVDSLEKTLMLGRIGGRRRRGRQRMRWLDGITDSSGHESQWTPGVGDGQGGLACCDSWGRKESDTTERLIWSDLVHIYKM